jgi:hypothetical protein
MLSPLYSLFEWLINAVALNPPLIKVLPAYILSLAFLLPLSSYRPLLTKSLYLGRFAAELWQGSEKIAFIRLWGITFIWG